jgi:hypothetical protein
VFERRLCRRSDSLGEVRKGGEASLRVSLAPDVTDIPAEKPAQSRLYCPGCEPEADVLLEILEVSWCEAHTPARAGVDDALAIVRGTGFGSAEAGGEDNRRWCEMIHGAPAQHRGGASRKPSGNARGT